VVLIDSSVMALRMRVKRVSVWIFFVTIFLCHYLDAKKLISIGLSDTAEFLRHLPAARAGRVGAAPGKSL